MLASRKTYSHKTALIAVSCGMLAAIVTYLVGRAAGFAYWHEAGMAMFYLVGIPVAAYRGGTLTKHPARVIAFAVVAAGVSAAIVSW